MVLKPFGTFSSDVNAAAAQIFYYPALLFKSVEQRGPPARRQDELLRWGTKYGCPI